MVEIGKRVMTFVKSMILSFIWQKKSSIAFFHGQYFSLVGIKKNRNVPELKTCGSVVFAVSPPYPLITTPQLTNNNSPPPPNYSLSFQCRTSCPIL